jgi:plasmid stabilization system protein ParE
LVEGAFQLILYPLAEQDLDEILSYLKSESVKTAEGFFNSLHKSFEKVAMFPELYPLSRDRALAEKGYRIIPIGNYLVFYIIREKEVQILRILFGRREYSGLLE